MSIPTKSVYISLSRNVYANQAVEDWLFRTVNFKDHQMLLMYSNKPCVIIGAFQNPWMETNPTLLPNLSKGILLARRRSGGGAVYHDEGNLNLTFFTSKKEYNRLYNLKFIQSLLQKKYKIPIDISSKFDLMLHGTKISGSAARLGLNSTYHHCTLLIDIDKIALKVALNKCCFQIKTNATKSIISEITNLNDYCSRISVENLIDDFKRAFLKSDNKVQYIIPGNFIEMQDLTNEFCSWEWLYGKTPKFSVSKYVKEIGNVTFHVEKGRIINFNVENEGSTCAKLQDYLHKYLNQRFDENIFL